MSKVFKSLGTTAKRRGKMPCLFELAYSASKENAVGRRVRRVQWTDDSYYTLTRVSVEPVPRANLVRGTVYGVLTWRGNTVEQEQRIRSGAKRDWAVGRVVRVCACVGACWWFDRAHFAAVFLWEFVSSG